MGKAVVKIAPGVCGLETVVEAAADADMHVHLQINSECERVQRLTKQLSEPISIKAVLGPYDQTFAVRIATQCQLHSSCPVPCGLVKATEVAAGLAVPADVHIEIRTQGSH